MRKTLLAAAIASTAIILFAGSSVAKRPGDGVVTSIDDASKTFGCHWNTSDWTYTTTAKTVFRMAGRPAGFSDLKVGETVRVKYHVVGKKWVADRVTITAS